MIADPGGSEGPVASAPAGDLARLSGAPAPPSEPLGVLATALWTAAVVAVFLAVQVAFAVAVGGTGTGEPSGTTVGVATLIAALPALLLLLLAASRRGRPASYLALDLPAPGVTVRWLLPFLLLLGCVDLLSWASGRDVVPPEVLEMVSTARPAWPLVLAVLLAAPVFEELLFRGFVYRGAAATRLGPVGSAALTAGLWAALHLHYAPYYVALVAVYGFALGLARWRTGSTTVAIVLHAAANLVALLQAFIALR